MKGLRHPVQNTISRTIRLLTMLLGIVAKSEKRDKFQVTQTSVPYLAALVSVSEEVRCRCHLKYQTTNFATRHKTTVSNKTPPVTAATNQNQGVKKNHPISTSSGISSITSLNSTSTNTTNTTNTTNVMMSQQSGGGTCNISMITQSPSNNSLIDELGNKLSPNSLTNNSNAAAATNNINISNSNLLTSQQPKRQHSCDTIDSRSLILAKTNNKPASGTTVQTPIYPTSLTIQQQPNKPTTGSK